MHLEALVHSYMNFTAWLIVLGTCGYALRRVRRDLREGQVPLLGMGAVFIALLQLIPLPLADGLRGHLCGALLLAMLLGPWATCLIVAAVVLVQALFSQGGLISLGSNIFNLGVVAGVGGYFLLNLLKSLFPKTRRWFLAATALAAWISFVCALLAADLNLFLAGAVLGQVNFLQRTVLLGLGEAMLTTSIIAILLAARPDLVLAYCCGGDKDVCYEEHHHHRTHHHH